MFGNLKIYYAENKMKMCADNKRKAQVPNCWNEVFQGITLFAKHSSIIRATFCCHSICST